MSRHNEMGSSSQSRLAALVKPQSRGGDTQDADLTWFIGSEIDPVGPFSLEEMRQKIRMGEIGSQTRVNRNGVDRWSGVWSDSILSQFLPSKLPMTPRVPRVERIEQRVNVDDLLDRAGASHIGKPAGLMIRFFASMLDGIFLAIFLGIVNVALARFLPEMNPNIRPSGREVMSVVNVTFIIPTLLSIALYALFETGDWQATPGKRICKIYVRRMDRHRISVAQSIGRYLLRSFPPFLFFSVFTVLLGSEKRAIHDMMSGTQVVHGSLKEQSDD